jgi:hypothetical protein
MWASVAADPPPIDTRSRYAIDNTITLRPALVNADEYQGRTPMQILQRIQDTIQGAVAAQPLRSGNIRIMIASPLQKAAVLRSVEAVADALGAKVFRQVSRGHVTRM